MYRLVYTESYRSIQTLILYHTADLNPHNCIFISDMFRNSFVRNSDVQTNRNFILVSIALPFALNPFLFTLFLLLCCVPNMFQPSCTHYNTTPPYWCRSCGSYPSYRSHRRCHSCHDHKRTSLAAASAHHWWRQVFIIGGGKCASLAARSCAKVPVMASPPDADVSKIPNYKNKYNQHVNVYIYIHIYIYVYL